MVETSSDISVDKVSDAGGDVYGESGALSSRDKAGAEQRDSKHTKKRKGVGDIYILISFGISSGRKWGVVIGYRGRRGGMEM